MCDSVRLLYLLVTYLLAAVVVVFVRRLFNFSTADRLGAAMWREKRADFRSCSRPKAAREEAARQAEAAREAARQAEAARSVRAQTGSRRPALGLLRWRRMASSPSL